MKKIKSEIGSITLFVIIAFLFCMIMLITLYWASTNNQISVLQSKQRIQEIYGKDVNNTESIYQEIKSIESVKSAESAKKAESAQNGENVQNDESIQNEESTQITESMENTEGE